MRSIAVTWSYTLLAWSDASETDVLLSACAVGERANYQYESLASHSSWPAEWSLHPSGASTLITIAQRYCTFILPSETSCGLDPILRMTEITVGLIFLARPCYFVKAQTLLVGYAYLTRVLRRIMKHLHLLLSSPRVAVAEYTRVWEPTCACRLLVITVSSFKWICT